MATSSGNGAGAGGASAQFGLKRSGLKRERSAGTSAQRLKEPGALAQWPHLSQKPEEVLCLSTLQELLRECFGPSGEPAARDLDFLETFSGDGAVTRGLRLMGFRGAAMDLRVSANHDLMSRVGFLTTLKLLARVRPGGFFWAAPPCSSWVFLNMGTSGRRDYRVAGNWQANPKIRCQNALCARVAALCYLASARHVHWAVEQPNSSLMFGYLPWSLVAEGLRPRQVRTHMGAFGGNTAKLTLLVGTAPFLGELQRSLTPADHARIDELEVRTAVKEAGGGVRGSGHDLKATQSYPVQFGVAVGVALRDLENRRGALAQSPDAGLLPIATRNSGDGELWHSSPEWFLKGVRDELCGWDIGWEVEGCLSLNHW